MKKFTTIAAMLAMVLVAAVPAFAQTTVDNSDNEFDFDGEFNDNNIAVNDSSQLGGNQSNINGNGNVNINEQEQDSGAFAGDVNYSDNDDRGFYYGDDSEDDNDSRSFYYSGDEDSDGIADYFDFFVVYGDFDNDGVNDEFENSFDGSSVVIAQ